MSMWAVLKYFFSRRRPPVIHKEYDPSTPDRTPRKVRPRVAVPRARRAPRRETESPTETPSARTTVTICDLSHCHSHPVALWLALR